MSTPKSSPPLPPVAWQPTAIYLVVILLGYPIGNYLSRTWGIMAHHPLLWGTLWYLMVTAHAQRTTVRYRKGAAYAVIALLGFVATTGIMLLMLLLVAVRAESL